MAQNSNPLALIRRDSRPYRVTVSSFRCAGGLHGFPTNSKSARLVSPRVKQREATRWLAAGGAGVPSECAARGQESEVRGGEDGRR
jgi:hypothetical protein